MLLFAVAIPVIVFAELSAKREKSAKLDRLAEAKVQLLLRLSVT
jgi:hypothetical protein